MSTRYLALLAALGMLFASGVLYHVLASDSEQLDAAATRVALVPAVVGDWQGHEEIAEARAFEQTGAKSYWMRSYVNQKSKASVLVILMCGRPGKMSVHTPEVCYSGAGYEMRDQPAAISINDAQFWSAQFAKKSGQLRLYWAWNSRGDWQASSAPRWEYRGEPFLYKLYVSHEINAQTAGTPQLDPTAEFLRVFVPELKQTLFPVGDS